MFEDWSPTLRERRGHWDTEGPTSIDQVAGDSPRATTRPRNTRQLQLSLVLSLAALVVGWVSWQQLEGTDGLLSGVAETLVTAPGRTRSALAPFNASALKSLDHLVMVAGHAVVLAEALDRIDSRDEAWFLEDYQRGQDVPAELVGHIRLGVQTAASDPRALLVFSGGQTRSAAGPRDEGFSYYRVAEHYGWWTRGSATTVSWKAGLGQDDQMESLPVAQRTVVEDFAMDSFQNLLFSLCRFREVLGRYPRRVTVVSFSFKRRRFQELHRRALRLPRATFTFRGLQPSGSSHFDAAAAERGELEHAARHFESDPFGCQTPALRAKRSARNPFRRAAPYALSCPELRPLLSWCGPGPFPGPLPWESSQDNEAAAAAGGLQQLQRQPEVLLGGVS